MDWYRGTKVAAADGIAIAGFRAPERSPVSDSTQLPLRRHYGTLVS
ncbi:MAG: hypothetical protein AB9919_06565 [Geobacteraceae bacterium]